MESDVEVVNHALIFLGQPPIQTIGDPTPPSSATAGVLFTPALEETLRAHPWNFAIKRVALAPLATAPAYGYSYQYARPADWLRTLECSADDYRHEGDKILCNDSSLQLRYVFREVSIDKWDALACAALARNLATKLAYPLTKSTTQQQAQWEMYAAVLQQARSVDAQEEPAEVFEESSLLAVRR